GGGPDGLSLPDVPVCEAPLGVALGPPVVAQRGTLVLDPPSDSMSSSFSSSGSSSAARTSAGSTASTSSSGEGGSEGGSCDGAPPVTDPMLAGEVRPPISPSDG